LFAFAHSETVAGADPGFAKGGRGADHGERVEREPIAVVWGRAPSRIQGQSPWWASGGAESFLSIFIQKSQKFSI